MCSKHWGHHAKHHRTTLPSAITDGECAECWHAQTANTTSSKGSEPQMLCFCRLTLNINKLTSQRQWQQKSNRLSSFLLYSLAQLCFNSGLVFCQEHGVHTHKRGSTGARFLHNHLSMRHREKHVVHCSLTGSPSPSHALVRRSSK